jgi:hypothetical protein
LLPPLLLAPYSTSFRCFLHLCQLPFTSSFASRIFHTHFLIPFQLLFLSSKVAFSSFICFSYLERLLLPLLLIIHIPLSVAFCASPIYFLISCSCFLHHSHLPLVPLSLPLAHSSVDSLTSFHCFLHLFQSFLIFSQLLIVFAHMPLA